MNKIFDCQLENTEVVGCDIMYCGRQEHVASSLGQMNEMALFTKMFIPIYQIIWCYIVNSNETAIQRVLPSPKVALDNRTHPQPNPPPQEKDRKQSSPILSSKRQESLTVHKTKCSVLPILYFHVSHTKGAS